MNSADFVIWLKGFVSASNNYNLTPAGWDTLKEELSKVNDNVEEPEEQPNEHLLEAARRYKEVIEEYDDYGKRVYNKQDRPTWYSTSTSDNLNN